MKVDHEEYARQDIGFIDLSSGHFPIDTVDIRFISDTHTMHRSIHPVPVDAIVHCGDEASHRDASLNNNQSADFFVWYTQYPADVKLFIPGNHSIAVRDGRITQDSLAGRSIDIVVDRTIDLFGYKLYGSPWTPRFGVSWAYMEKRNRMDQIWKLIPDDTDILVTHGPPKGIMDLSYDYDGDDPSQLAQVGCRSLYNRVREVMPRIHAFGHLHDVDGEMHNYGALTRKGTTFINSSCCELRGQFRHQGYVVRLPKRRQTDNA